MFGINGMEFDIGNESFENLLFTLRGVPSSHLPIEEQGELSGHSLENIQRRLGDHFHSEDSALRVIVPITRSSRSIPTKTFGIDQPIFCQPHRKESRRATRQLQRGACL